jgi:hypothetical protein
MAPATVTCAVLALTDTFAVTEKLTVPSPEPLDRAGVSHEALSLTCHAQPAVLATRMTPEPASGESVIVRGLMSYRQVPCWVTVTAMPAMVICALRTDAPVLAVTENVTFRVPLPLETDGVSHDACSRTCHAHSFAVVRSTLPELAPAASVTEGGVTAYVQLPGWVTATAMPAIVSRAVRGDPLEFAVTANLMVAPPDPLVTSEVSHDALSLTCQLQPAAVVTRMLPAPAVAARVTAVGVTL